MRNVATSSTPALAGLLTVLAAMLLLAVSVSSSLLQPIKVHAQSAAPQDLLPEAPNKQLVVAKCTQCHGADQFASHRQSASAWDETVNKMQSKGLVLTDDDYDKVLAYLSTNLAPLPSPVNINTGSASDIQKALDLTDKETQAIVKAREANGSFKDWHDVAKVEGIDPKKIEAKKDLLTF
jgi:competence protein ComEA